MDDIMVEGIPFALGSDEHGYVITATDQRVHVVGSPIIISFDPPILPTVDLGNVYQAILAKLP